ncbi:growth arrest-specific protein 1b [Neosynchiropus ocellatus]
MDRTALWICGMLVLLAGFCAGSPNHSRRLVCWKAILKCHGEPECHYAYDQYMYACASVLTGERKKCPSHCISSLVQLNLTISGPALEDCDCALDPVCRLTKQAIEPCLPRTRPLGCTEAWYQCQSDPACSAAMQDYLTHCRNLFGGGRCSESCRRVIAHMRTIKKAQQLDTCVCDGAERNICEYVKVSMETCSDSGDGFEGSGLSDSEDESEDDYPDYYAESSGEHPAGVPELQLLTSIFVLSRFF